MHVQCMFLILCQCYKNRSDKIMNKRLQLGRIWCSIEYMQNFFLPTMIKLSTKQYAVSQSHALIVCYWHWKNILPEKYNYLFDDIIFYFYLQLFLASPLSTHLPFTHHLYPPISPLISPLSTHLLTSSLSIRLSLLTSPLSTHLPLLTSPLSTYLLTSPLSTQLPFYLSIMLLYAMRLVCTVLLLNDIVSHHAENNLSVASIEYYWNNYFHLICCVLLSGSDGGHVYWLYCEKEVQSNSSSSCPGTISVCDDWKWSEENRINWGRGQLCIWSCKVERKQCNTRAILWINLLPDYLITYIRTCICMYCMTLVFKRCVHMICLNCGLYF